MTFPPEKPIVSPNHGNSSERTNDSIVIPKTESSIDLPERSLHWHLLGGNNQSRIGANAGLCVYEETNSMGVRERRALLVDAGVMYGDGKHPENPVLAGCDTVIADLTKFLVKKDDPSHVPDIKIDSIFLTHNHSDHLGALPFMLLMGYELPKIYATPYTTRRLEQELTNAGIDPKDWPEIYAIAPGKAVQEGPVKVTAFWVSHSTPQSVGFFIETPEGNILNPGDFKLDQSVVWGPAFNEEQFRRVVSKPVDLLLLDSTGADRDIEPVTEEDVRETLRELMELHPGKRFVIAVMSGFEENLASVAKVAAEYDRTVWVSGWSHEQSLSALKETGMSLQDHVGGGCEVRLLHPGKATRDLEEAKPGSSIVVVTGAQGMPSAVLTRAADGRHPQLKLDPEKDIVLFCAPSIPGQEGSRQSLFATLRREGIPFYTRADLPHLYSHAHARLPEILDLSRMADAKCVLPIHGDARLRKACGDAIAKTGKKTMQADNGDVIKVSKDGAKSIAPATKDNPKLIGYKTLQGSTWQDKHYLMIQTPDKKPDPVDIANQNKRAKSKIFNIGPK